MSIFPELAIIALLVIVGFALYGLSGFTLPIRGKKPIPEPTDPAPSISGMPPLSPGSSGTLLDPILYIDQLHPTTMQVLKRFEVDQIPENGLTISRPNAVSGSIKLDPSVKEAFSVSQEHARLGMDDQGIFLQEYRGQQRMRLMKNRMAVQVDEVNITDGTVVYLGRQPLRFSVPDFFSNFAIEDGDTRIFDGNTAAAPAKPVESRFTRRNSMR